MWYLLFFFIPIVFCVPYFDIHTGLSLNGTCANGSVYLKNNSQVGYVCKEGQLIYDACYPLRHESVRTSEGETWYDSSKEGTFYQCTQDEFVVRGCMHASRFYSLGQRANISGVELEARRVWDSAVCKFKCSLLTPDNDSLCEPPKNDSNWGKEPDQPNQDLTPVPAPETTPVNVSAPTTLSSPVTPVTEVPLTEDASTQRTTPAPLPTHSPETFLSSTEPLTTTIPSKALPVVTSTTELSTSEPPSTSTPVMKNQFTSPVSVSSSPTTDVMLTTTEGVVEITSSILFASTTRAATTAGRKGAPVTIPPNMDIAGADLATNNTNMANASITSTTAKPRARGGNFEELDLATPIRETNTSKTHVSHHNRTTQTKETTRKVVENVVVFETWIHPKKVPGLQDKQFSGRYRRKCFKDFWESYNMTTEKFCTKEYDDKFEGCSLLTPVCKDSILSAFEKEATKYTEFKKYSTVFESVLAMRDVGEMAFRVIEFLDALEELAEVHFESPILYGAVERFVAIFDTRFSNMRVEGAESSCALLINRCSNRDVASCRQLQQRTECHEIEIAANDCCLRCLEGHEMTVNLVKLLCPHTCLVGAQPQNDMSSLQMAFEMQDTLTCPAS